MKHTYQVTGMSCNGCKSHVEKALSGVEHVTSVHVDLEKAEAVVDMNEEVPFSKLKDALSDSHYTILDGTTQAVKKN